jgi:hypothetical protein
MSPSTNIVTRIKKLVSCPPNAFSLKHLVTNSSQTANEASHLNSVISMYRPTEARDF